VQNECRERLLAGVHDRVKPLTPQASTLSWGPACMTCYERNGCRRNLRFKYPFLIERKAHEYVNDVCDDIGEVCRLHELGNERCEPFAPRSVGEYVGRTFQNEQVDEVRAEENDDEPCDFGALFVRALEVPDAVAEVAVEPAGDKSEKIREFQVPVEDLMENPDGCKRNQCVHYADNIVFDKVFHGR